MSPQNNVLIRILLISTAKCPVTPQRVEVTYYYYIEISQQCGQTYGLWKLATDNYLAKRIKKKFKIKGGPIPLRKFKLCFFFKFWMTDITYITNFRPNPILSVDITCKFHLHVMFVNCSHHEYNKSIGHLTFHHNQVSFHYLQKIEWH